MKRTTALILVFITFQFFFSSLCLAQSEGDKSVNSADELKAYLDTQPANSPDNPIKVAMRLNEQMFQKVNEAITSAGKYVSLNLTGSSLRTIPEVAFFDQKKGKGCQFLVSITIPDSVTSIGKGAFADCTSLESITIPNRVISIGESAFFGCTSFTSVTIPDSVTSIGDGVFAGCPSLTTINIGSGNKAYFTENGILFNKNKIILISYPSASGSYTIPNSITSIGRYAFYGCTSLSSITIPNIRKIARFT